MKNSSNATVLSILDAAQSITQAVGYNGLSFRDLAAMVGIKSASVHYYFPSKAHLGAAVARRYTDRLLDYLKKMDAQNVYPKETFEAYLASIRATLLQDGRMCLCGMLAAELDALPQEVRAEVHRFIDLNVAWIASAIERATSVSSTTNLVQDQALAIFAALEGAMLVARGTCDINKFDAITAQYVRAGLIPQ